MEGTGSASPRTTELALHQANVLPKYMVRALEILRILPSLTGKHITRVAGSREEYIPKFNHMLGSFI